MGGGGGMGGGGDMPPGGGPPSQAQMQRRMVRSLKRQLSASSTDFAAMLPDIEKIIQLRQAIDGTTRPEPPGRPGGDDNGGGGGPPEMNGGGGGDPNGGGGGPGGGGGGGGGDPQNGGGGGGGGGNDHNADAATTTRHRRRAAQDGNDAQPADNAGNGSADADAQVAPDALASDLTAKVRALRASLRQSDPADAADADVTTGVTDVRAARTRAVDELTAARKDLKTMVKSARQEAVLVAAGILD